MVWGAETYRRPTPAPVPAVPHQPEPSPQTTERPGGLHGTCLYPPTSLSLPRPEQEQALTTHTRQRPASKDKAAGIEDKDFKDQPRQAIRAEIARHMVPSGDLNDPQYREVRFVPRAALRQLLADHRPTIEELFKRNAQKLGDNWTARDTKKLAEYAIGEAPECFAILSFHIDKAGKLVGLIHQFFESGFDDRMLPVRAQHTDGGLTRIVSGNPDDEVNRDDAGIVAEAFRLGSLWSDNSRDSFCHDWQWLFHVPVFRADRFEYNFDLRVRLPFISCEENGEETGFSYPVQNRLIHRDHFVQDGNWV